MKKDSKLTTYTTISFTIGLILYLTGLILMFGTNISKLEFAKKFLFKFALTNNMVENMKLYGALLFLVGFVVFIVSVILLYKNNKIMESTKVLIIEGQADVITLIVMSFVLIIMLFMCLLFDQLIGALLFGVALLIQNIVNGILLRYFSRNTKKRV